MLERLVELKAEEVYRGWSELDDSEVREKEVRKVKWDLAEIAMEETEQGHGNMEEGTDE